MLKTLKTHKVSVLLLLTIVVGVGVTSFDFGSDRFVLLNGHESKQSVNSVAYFVAHYIIGFIMVGALLVNNRTEIDKWVIINYLWWDFIGLLSYLYQGWPEPKFLIIVCFTTSISILVILNILKK